MRRSLDGQTAALIGKAGAAGQAPAAGEAAVAAGQVLRHGQSLFVANWTDQEGVGAAHEGAGKP
ncbi:MAG: hypothetical protein IPJ98_26245 [Bryobacterales bacterium]|nr:hypothetical protein [Bryobacterales bacterium]